MLEWTRERGNEAAPWVGRSYGVTYRVYAETPAMHRVTISWPLRADLFGERGSDGPEVDLGLMPSGTAVRYVNEHYAAAGRAALARMIDQIEQREGATA